MGRREQALEIAADIRNRPAKLYPSEYSMAVVYVGLGDRSQALDWLEKAYDSHDNSMPFVAVDLRFDSLRQEPRFRAILGKLKIG